jgi:pimeloyl-ACP methyl ester carboxylesterase
VVQNGNAYDEGLDNDFWEPIKRYWADQSQENRDALRKLFSLELTKFQYTDGMANISRISPDNWVADQALLDRPGNNEIQLDYFLDYGTNPALYPAVQEWLRAKQPPTLVVWGANDIIFPAEGAHPYKRDLQDVEFHLFDSGHFLLEDRADEVFPLIYDFLARKLG